jgi:Methyltransferase small domain
MLTDGAFYRIPADAQRILEPSAGKGNIAQAVRDYCQFNRIEAKVHCCEIIPRFQQHLLSENFDVTRADFLDFNPPWAYDAIVMNPPFSIEGDPLAYITHIEHAWSLLAPDGILLAIVPGGFTFRDDKRIRQFRELLEDHGTWRELDGDAFKASGTGVKTVIISMKK